MPTALYLQQQAEATTVEPRYITLERLQTPLQCSVISKPESDALPREVPEGYLELV